MLQVQSPSHGGFRCLAKFILLQDAALYFVVLSSTFCSVVVLYAFSKDTDKLPIHRQHAVSDSRRVNEMDAWASYRIDEPWEQEYMTVLVQGKGEADGSDMATKETLAKLEDLLALWSNLNVTTESGRFFSIWDLCYRGPAIPDLPDSLSQQTQGLVTGPLYMPCLSPSILDCFSEKARFLHRDSYFRLDNEPALLRTIFGNPVKPYSLRPSYRDKTSQEIKAILMNSSINPVGCPWYTQEVTFPLFTMLLGHSEHSNGLLTNAPYLMATQFYDGPRRMAFRKLGTTFPRGLSRGLEEELQEFDEARRLHMDKFYESVIEFSKVAHDVEFLVLRPWDDELTKMGDKYSQPPWLQIVIIALLHLQLPGAFLNFDSPVHSRCLAVYVGVSIHLMNIVGALGVYFLLGRSFTAVMGTIAIPVALVFGTDDVLVSVHTSLHIDREFCKDKDTTTIMEEILIRTLPNIAFKSLTRILMFVIGLLVQIRAVDDVCIFMSAWAVLHFATMVTVFMLYLSLESLRAKYLFPEPICFFCNTGLLCTCCPKKFPCSPDYKIKHFGPRRTTLPLGRCRKLCSRPPVYTCLSFMAVTLCVLSITAISLAERVELPVEAFTEKGSHANDALRAFFRHFGNFQSYLVYWDVDVPVYQKNMLELYESVTGIDGNSPGIFPPFLSNFYTTWGTGIDGFFNESSWTHPALAPFGTTSTDEHYFYSNYHLWNVPVLSNDSLFTNLTTSFTEANAPLQSACWAGSDDLASIVYTCEEGLKRERPFLSADLSSVNEFSYYAHESNVSLPHWKLRLSFMKFWNQVSTASAGPTAYVDMMHDAQDIISKARVFQDNQVFLTGISYDLGESIVQIKTRLYRQVLPIYVFGIVVIAAIVLCSIRCSLLITLSIMMIFLETWGLVTSFVPLTTFTAIWLILAAAFSLQYVHLVVVFSQLKVTDWENCVMTSLEHLLPALITSSVIMLLSCFVMVSAPLSLTVSYFCIPFGVMTGVGMLNGCIIQPCLLMAMSRIPWPFAKEGREVTV